jgi:hypothetical protein
MNGEDFLFLLLGAAIGYYFVHSYGASARAG